MECAGGSGSADKKKDAFFNRGDSPGFAWAEDAKRVYPVSSHRPRIDSALTEAIPRRGSHGQGHRTAEGSFSLRLRSFSHPRRTPAWRSDRTLMTLHNFACHQHLFVPRMSSTLICSKRPSASEKL
ncbi:hypothetical protein BaRGS_00022771 [Batillaria attramentaria]|uniref:Uncharacterized protein n=1 Tax=Batillaria attramentaria TaxID=370345 RepID=A0ABD0KFQ9_9CAEN